MSKLWEFDKKSDLNKTAGVKQFPDTAGGGVPHRAICGRRDNKTWERNYYHWEGIVMGLFNNILWEWINMIGNKAEDVINPITLFLCLSPHIRDSPSLEWDKSNVINLETCESKNNGTRIWILLLF